MKQYIERLCEIMKDNPNKIILTSEGKSHGLSYKILDENSGKIYSWLKTNGYGKEDVILICLPRGVRIVVTMIGILRAGAAFTVVESTYGKDRIEFIKKDCGCRLVIDEYVFNQMMDANYLDGCEKADPHDAAFAVYTSGSTGNPKGALHEYGQLENIVRSQYINGESLLDETKKFALLAPMNFVATICATLSCLIFKASVYIIPYSVVKDLTKMSSYIKKNEITTMFMAPSLMHAFKNIPDCLQVIILGSEPCNNIYRDNVDIYNFYSMSEAAYFVAKFKLDKLYDIAPIGKPSFENITQILDENGNSVLDGEIGELCLKNDYFRGYINLPDKNKEVFKYGLFHTGDLAKKDENGNIILLGRNDDMIKINGNRIEPAEIEAAVSRLFGFSKVIAKGFINSASSFVAVYYLKTDAIKTGKTDSSGNLIVDYENVNNELLKHIPYYMLPSYYVGLDAFPLNPNGKIAKKELPMPTIGSNNEYVAPRDEIEERICDVFSNVLNRKMGINDDFYLCGGDSLSSITSLSELDFVGLNIGDIFKYRTPAKIAEYYKSISKMLNNIDEINDAYIKEKQPLLVEQINMVDFQFLAGKSAMWNLTQMYKLKPDVNLNRLSDAIDKAILCHPAFLTVIDTNEDGEFVQYYDRSLFKNTEITNITEKELEDRKPSLIRNMTLLKSLLYRCNIFKTEKAAYMFFDVHHLITDGTSLAVFRNDVAGFYFGTNYKPKKDYYYYALYENKMFEQSPKYLEAVEYFKQYNDDDYCGGIARDVYEKGSRMGSYSKTIDITSDDFDRVPVLKENGQNAIFALATAMVEAATRKCYKIQINWLNNGRDDSYKLNICGLMFKTMRLYFDFASYKNLNELYDDLKNQLNATMAYGLYPRYNQCWEAGLEKINVFFQKGIYDLGPFEEIAEEWVDLPSLENAADAAFDVEMIETNGKYNAEIQYSASMYTEDTVAKVVDYIEKAIKLLIKYGKDSQKDIITIIEEITEK